MSGRSRPLRARSTSRRRARSRRRASRAASSAYGVERALRTMRPRGVSGLRRVFVGRDSELELLRATYRRAAAQSDPHLVTIVGEPGVGKSRLVRRALGRARDGGAGSGRAAPAGASPTARASRTGRSARWCASTSGSARELRRTRSPSGSRAARSSGSRSGSTSHPSSIRSTRASACTRRPSRSSRSSRPSSPIVLVVEDIHWAEPDLLDLLERLVADVRAPVMLVATARPEILDLRPTWGAGKRNATVLWLDPLSATPSSQLLEEKLPDAPRRAARPARRARRRQPVLPRGARRRARRQRRARPVGGRVGGRALTTRGRDARHRPRRARRADRPPSGEREGGAAGRCGRWDACSRRRRSCISSAGERARLRRCSRSATSSRPSRRSAPSAASASSRSSTRSRARSRTGRSRRLVADGCTRRSRTGSPERAAPTSARPLLAYHYAEAAKDEDADLVWADEPDELDRVRACAVHWLSRAGQARARAPRDRRGGRALRPRDRAVDDAHERALLWRAVGEAQALALRRRRNAEGVAARSRRAARRRGAGGHVRIPRLPVVDQVGDVVDPPEHGAHRGVGGEGARARGGRERGEGAGASRAGEHRAARCSGGRPRGGRQARGVARQPRAPLVRARCANADCVRPAAVPGGGGLERATARAAARDRRSGSPVRGLRGGLARGCGRLPLRRGAAAWPSFTPSLSQRLSAAPSRPLRLARARAGGRARRLAGARFADGSRVAAIDANLATPCVRNPRDLLLLRPRAPLPGRRVAGDRARARRAASRRRGVRDVPERRQAPDRAGTRRPCSQRSRSSSFPSSVRSSGGRGSSPRGSTPSSPSDGTTASSGSAGAGPAGDDRRAVRAACARCRTGRRRAPRPGGRAASRRSASTGIARRPSACSPDSVPARCDCDARRRAAPALVAFERERDESVEELRVRDPGRLEELRVHARRREARDRVDLVHDDLAVRAHEEVDAGHPLALGGDERLDCELAHACVRLRRRCARG